MCVHVKILVTIATIESLTSLSLHLSNKFLEGERVGRGGGGGKERRHGQNEMEKTGSTLKRAMHSSLLRDETKDAILSQR